MWKAIVAGVVMAVMLLLALIILVILYLRKARGKASNGEPVLFVFADKETDLKGKVSKWLPCPLQGGRPGVRGCGQHGNDDIPAPLSLQVGLPRAPQQPIHLVTTRCARILAHIHLSS